MYTVSGDWQSVIGKRLAEWYIKKSGWNFWTIFTAIGFLDEEMQIRGVAIFTDYTGASCELHIIGDRILSRENLAIIAKYVFIESGCVRLTIKLERKNRRFAKILHRIGFEYEATLKSYYGLQPSQDALVYRIMRPQAEQWIR